jgi:hypothetical protein
MRTARSMASVRIDLMHGEIGPAAPSVVSTTHSPTNFLFAMHLTEHSHVDAAKATMLSLIRSRTGSAAPRLFVAPPAQSPFGACRVLLLWRAGAESGLRELCALPWASVGVEVAVQNMAECFAAAQARTENQSEADAMPPPTSETLTPIVREALGHVQAMRAAMAAAKRAGVHLVWVMPGILFGADPLRDLWGYSLRVAVMAGLAPRTYSMALMLVPVCATVAGNTLLNMMRGALVRDARSGRSGLLAKTGMCDGLLDEYLTHELLHKHVPHQVLLRTRFLPSTSIAAVVQTCPPAGRIDIVDVFGQPASVLEDFLAHVERPAGVVP